MNIYEKFLRMLEFTDEEMPDMLPKWELACKRIGLTREDVRFSAEEWIPTYWDMSLKGVRMCIGAYIRELIELSRMSDYKAMGHKILYGNTPCHPSCFYANKLAADGKLHIVNPDYLLSSVYTAFFNKQTSGAGSCMSQGCAHCGKSCMRADAQQNSLIVQPDVVWNWGLYCNEAPKTEELLQCIGNSDWTCVLTTAPKDVPLGVHEADSDYPVNYLASQLRLAQKEISAITGYEVRDEHIHQASDYYLCYLGKIEELEKLVTGNEPQPMSGNDFTLFGAMMHANFDTGFKYLNRAIDTVLDEVRERVAKKQGPLPADSPRVACHFVPYTSPWITREFMNNGVNLIGDMLFATASMINKCEDDDVYRLMARQWLTNPSAVNMMDEANILSEMLTDCKVDGVVHGFYYFDRWLGALNKLVIRIVEENTGIPHYYMETDFWSSVNVRQKDRVARIRAIANDIKINHILNGRKQWQETKS